MEKRTLIESYNKMRELMGLERIDEQVAPAAPATSQAPPAVGQNDAQVEWLAKIRAYMVTDPIIDEDINSTTQKGKAMESAGLFNIPAGLDFSKTFEIDPNAFARVMTKLDKAKLGNKIYRPTGKKTTEKKVVHFLSYKISSALKKTDIPKKVSDSPVNDYNAIIKNPGITNFFIAVETMQPAAQTPDHLILSFSVPELQVEETALPPKLRATSQYFQDNVAEFKFDDAQYQDFLNKLIKYVVAMGGPVSIGSIRVTSSTSKVPATGAYQASGNSRLAQDRAVFAKNQIIKDLKAKGVDIPEDKFQIVPAPDQGPEWDKVKFPLDERRKNPALQAEYEKVYSPFKFVEVEVVPTPTA